ncbi:universal stress protein [Variovorax ginsengisoli]|uniref:Universal stress protein n=1 Tax=Variovorax ginsengisoli TaxID=363844 RepID=A0ABT8SEA3_9BURK|nr:universal stress protein [Variovorax ginsengisoli]MDN8617489.1 universal stress protein [Variovorax ginsengisoli]MDO1536659.1 universal stress protein [Variovorax ginsengisoli]
MKFHSILAITDLSPRSNRAVLRASMLASQQRALLKIMYAPSSLDGSTIEDVEQQLKRIAAEVHTRFGILVKMIPDTSGHLEAVAEEARWADLLVLSERWEKSTEAFFRGQPIERLQRLVPCPILVVKLEVFHRYRRILVAVDFTPYSKKLLKLARWLDSDARIEPFHARSTMLGGNLRYQDVSKQSILPFRSQTNDAQEHSLQAGDSIAQKRNRIATVLGRNGVARQAVIHQQHLDADLIVVGKRRSSGLSDFLFGSVAHLVLRWSSRDVLLVPHDMRIDPNPELAASFTSSSGQIVLRDHLSLVM